MHPGRRIASTDYKTKDKKKAVRKILGLISEYKVRTIIAIISSALSSVFFIIGPKKMGNITTEIFKGIVSKYQGGTGIDFDAILKLVLVLLGLYLVGSAFRLIQGLIMTDVSQSISYNLRKKLAEKIQKLPISYFDTTSQGDILSRVTNDIDTLSQALNQSLTQIISSFTTIVGVLFMMFTISWQMTLVAILILPISGFLMSFIMKRSQKYFTNQQKYLGAVNGIVEETYAGQNIVKAFNAEHIKINEFEKENTKLYSVAWKSQFLSSLMQPIMSFVGNLGYVLMVVMGTVYAASGLITVGDIQAFVQYIRQLNQPIMQTAQITSVLQSTIAASERVFEFLEAEDEKDIISDNTEIYSDKSFITFEHVKFGYKKDEILIKDFNLNVEKGKKIAIVGPTGAGKTTLVKLLLRFYDLNEGVISYNGRDIASMSRYDIRSKIGMVLQDTWLFNGTIRENIRYGNISASDEDVENAAKVVQAHHFIEALPDGYEMILNEDTSNISQGQKQLITIARAVLADPEILVLDEATSSVDTRTEILIQKAMDNLMQNRTSFIIAHRLSTIKNADTILVLKDGDIIEKGTHDQLISNEKGFYKELYQSQFDTIE